MLRDVLDQSFVLVKSGWSTDNVRRRIQRLQPSHLIVHRTIEGAEAYYLIGAQEALDHLTAAGNGKPVLAALDLDQRAAAPVLDAYDNELSAPAQVVVLDNGLVIGFLDSRRRARIWRRRTRALSGEVEAVQRTPRTLVTSFPGEVVAGEIYWLLVSLSVYKLEGQPQLDASPGTVIDVYIEPRCGFEVIGTRERSIIATDKDESPALRFKLRAMGEGLGVILVHVFTGEGMSKPVSIKSRILVSANGTTVDIAPDSLSKHERHETPLQLPSGETSIPDLILIITEDRSNQCLTFMLKPRDRGTWPKSKPLFYQVVTNVDSLRYSREFLEKIDNLPRNTPENRNSAEQKLRSLGFALFKQLFPKELQCLLWTQRERIHTVQIRSQEVWIPWELCRLYGWDDSKDSKIIKGPFFAEAFAITRWLPDLETKPKLSLRKMALVVPERSGLRHAVEEREYMLSLSRGERQVTAIPANPEKVLDALENGGYDGWHFTCRGSASPTPDFAELVLDDGKPIYLADLSGSRENLGRDRPLVFLNACESGQGTISLTGISGWAHSFLRAAADRDHPTYGAAAFVGTYWRIDDLAALEFAKAFYAALLEDRLPMGDAVMRARSAVRSLHGLDWLAYTVFAHPLATVE